MRFVTFCHGNNYAGFLLACLYSIIKTHPQAEATVFWQDIDYKKINILNRSFPKTKFIKTSIQLHNNFIKKISSKTSIWLQAAQKYRGEKICLLDCDTLIIKNLEYLFSNKFDIAFTTKKEKIPINTGVMLLKGKSTCSFLKKWDERTVEILSNEDEFNKANDATNYPYGGADQMSFYQILNYKDGVGEYKINIDNEEVKLISFPCYILNETRSTQITNETRLIHYKGGWREILINGFFTKHRSKKDSHQMHIRFLQTLKEALDSLKNQGYNLDFSFFNIKFPFYLNKKNFKSSKVKYLLFVLKQNCWHKPILLLSLLLKKLKRTD